MLEVIYPKENHECKDSEIEGGYLFICPQCGYRRRQMLDGKIIIEERGDLYAGHYGNAGVCKLLGIAQEIITGINDACARASLGDTPKSWTENK